jgi:hypothetical protein
LHAHTQKTSLPEWIQEFRQKSAFTLKSRKTGGQTTKIQTPNADSQRFLRLQRVGERCIELQTAVVRYRLGSENATYDGSATLRNVDFIAMVHLADPKYYTEVQAFAEVCVYMYVYMYACMCVCVSVCVCMNVCMICMHVVCMYVCMYACMYTQVCVYIYIYIYIYINIHTYMYTYKQTKNAYIPMYHIYV